MSPAKAPRRAGGGLLLRIGSAILGSLALLSCSGGDPASPIQDPVADNTYVRATITILDTGSPCTALTCEPELFECRSRNPIAAGRQWLIRANTASAGSVSPTQFVVTGTDTMRLTSLALEMRMDFSVTPPTASFTIPPGMTSSLSTWADIDTQCDQAGGAGPESRFHLVRGDTDSSITLMSVNHAGGSLVPAQPDGQGGYSPESIVEGTFSFVGQVLQSNPTGTLTSEALVEGCFRVNLPSPERGVPVTATPSAPACN